MGKPRDDIESLSGTQFSRWISGTEVIAAIFGMVFVGMAVMGATGVTWKYPVASNIEVSAASR